MELGNREDVLPILESLGMTKLEAQIYLALLTRAESKAKEIVQAFNIHFPQFYSLTSNLERKGFIEIQESRPKRYRAIDPKIIAQRKIKEMEKGAELLIKSVEEMRKKTEILQRPSVWITKGVQNILYNVNEIIKSAKYDVTIVMENKFLSSVIKSLVNKKSKGAQIYLLVYPEQPEPDAIKQINKLNRVRTFETCPFGILVIADCERAIMAHGLLDIAPKERQYGVVFDEPLTPIFFSERFYELWVRAKPLFSEKYPELPKSFRSQRMALMEIKNLLNKGEVIVRVKGRNIRSGETFEVEGTVGKITDNELHKNFTLKIPDGKTMTIGGFYSMREEIEAELITILKNP